MKTGIIIAVVTLLWAGPAAAECVPGPTSDISVVDGAGQDQKIMSYHTGAGWSQTIEVMPSWMRAQRAFRRGYDIIDLWGIPRSGTYKVSVRYTNSQKSIVCHSHLRFK